MKGKTTIGVANLASLAVAGLLLSVPLQAEVKSHSGNQIVEEPSDLPEMAKTPGQALFLYQAGDGATYLYVEQHDGERLAIYDVTDPAKIKGVASVPVKGSGTFEFVRYLNERTELVRYRESRQAAVLDLSNPKSPTLKSVDDLSQPGQTETLGQTALVMINGHYRYVGSVPHDYRLMDVSNPEHSVPLATIKQVRHKLVDEETGTTYLLGSDGLTVVRRPRVEEDHKIEKIHEEWN